jgi:pyruvate/2-oxoglutarate dehydrogenase complex dihydrolipoamide acyltransferase (E2) component
MTNTLTEKLQSLETMVGERETALTKQLRVTAWVIGILAIAAIIYTTVVANMLLSFMTPQQLASQFQAFLRSELPSARTMVINHAKANSAEYVQAVGNQLLGFIPNAESYAKSHLDEGMNALMKNLESDITPILGNYISKLTPELRESLKTEAGGDPNKMFGLVLSNSLEKELDAILTKDFDLANALCQFNSSIMKYKDPANIKTRHDDAVRRTLIYWSWLSKQAGDAMAEEGGDHGGMMEMMSERVRGLFPSMSVSIGEDETAPAAKPAPKAPATKAQAPKAPAAPAPKAPAAPAAKAV